MRTIYTIRMLFSNRQKYRVELYYGGERPHKVVLTNDYHEATRLVESAEHGLITNLITNEILE